jgi:hypothetical protein
MAAVYQMVSSSARHGLKLRTPKPIASPGDLAKRFLELQQLREQVYELERLATLTQKRAPPLRTRADKARQQQ